MDKKMTYEKPTLTVIGKVEELTLGSKDGDSLDAAFPVHTPKKNLTFS